MTPSDPTHAARNLNDPIGSALTSSSPPAEVLLEAAFASAPLAIALFGLDMRCLLANPALSKLTGTPLKLLLGRSLKEILPAFASTLEPMLREVLDSGRPLIDSMLSDATVEADGSKRYWKATAYPIFAPEGQGIAAGLIVSEAPGATQAQDALRQSEEQFRVLAEAMPQFVWVSDAEGKVEYVNPRWTDYTGQTVEQTGPDSDSVIHPEDALIMWERWKEARASGKDYELEFRCRRLTDGAYRWFLARGVPLKDAQGKIIRWIGTSTDIDVQKQAEAQITLLNSRLHRAIYESSHRIKNQLQILASTVDLALLYGNDFISADQFQRLGAQIQTLSVLQDILTLEWKLDLSGAVEMISIQKMLEQVLTALRQTNDRRNVSFQIADRALPVSTVTALALIANEAASNAIKHGMHSVEVTFSNLTDTGVLEICDDGPGFPDGFDPRLAANTGLELISALAVHDLQGRVHYENRSQGGARVVITFPLPLETEPEQNAAT